MRIHYVQALVMLIIFSSHCSMFSYSQIISYQLCPALDIYHLFVISEFGVRPRGILFAPDGIYERSEVN